MDGIYMGFLPALLIFCAKSNTLLMKTQICILILGMVVLAAGNASFPSLTIDQPDQLEQDSFNQKAAIEAILDSIKGREEEPAEDVFENIELFGKMPAGRLLRVMEMGFSRSLGVNCTHCHDPNDWASEEKHSKQISRDMMAMVGNINNELLAGISNLENDKPAINCTTCHRGEVVPATNLK